MESTLIKETMDILKRLSPKNQAYFMTLVRVAEIAENGARDAAAGKQRRQEDPLDSDNSETGDAVTIKTCNLAEEAGE